MRAALDTAVHASADRAAEGDRMVRRWGGVVLAAGAVALALGEGWRARERRRRARQGGGVRCRMARISPEPIMARQKGASFAAGVTPAHSRATGESARRSLCAARLANVAMGPRPCRPFLMGG